MTNEEYKQELDRLSALYDSYIENGKSQIEQFREMGIIKSIAKEEEEALEEVEEAARGYLDSVRSSFQQLIDDTSIDIDKWSKDMRNTILRNLMESKLLDEAFDETHFYITSNGITVYFNEYDIAPSAEGVPTFDLSYADLAQLMAY